MHLYTKTKSDTYLNILKSQVANKLMFEGEIEFPCFLSIQVSYFSLMYIIHCFALFLTTHKPKQQLSYFVNMSTDPPLPPILQNPSQPMTVLDTIPLCNPQHTYLNLKITLIIQRKRQRRKFRNKRRYDFLKIIIHSSIL